MKNEEFISAFKISLNAMQEKGQTVRVQHVE